MGRCPRRDSGRYPKHPPVDPLAVEPPPRRRWGSVPFLDVVRYGEPRPEGPVRKAVRRVTVTLAAMAVVLGVVVGLVPARAEPVEYSVPPGVVEVNCGAAFTSTRWSGDEACEREIVGRIIGTTLLFFFAFILLLIALPLLILRFRIWMYGKGM